MASGTQTSSKDSKVLMISLYLVAYGLLLILYRYYLVPYWSYLGFEADPNGVKIAAGAAVIVAFVLATPGEASARSFFLNLMLTIYLLPSMTVYGFADKPTSSAIVVWTALATVFVASSVPLTRVVVSGVRAKTLMWSLAGATGCLLLGYYALGSFENFNLDISRVYEFRREAAAELPGLFNYLASSFSKIVIPFGITASLLYRKYLFTVLFVLASLILFGFTSHKSVIFSAFLVVAVFLLMNLYSRYSIIVLMFVLALILGIVSTLFVYYDGVDSIFGWYNTLLIRRSLMTPALIDYNYLEFFSSSNLYYYWSTSRLTLGLIPSVHGIPAPNLIGEAYFGSVETSANTGFIGSGFAQAGIAGVLVYSVGVGLVFAVLQTYARYLGLPFVAAVMVHLAIIMITTTDFLTLFFTHGMLLALILLASIRPPVAKVGARARPGYSAATALRQG